jgi:hypothetical protein
MLKLKKKKKIEKKKKKRGESDTAMTSLGVGEPPHVP